MVKVTRLGHAAVLIEGSKRIIVDPFLSENPLASIRPEELPSIDYVLVTHDHFDHIGDAIAIAKRDEAKFVSIFDLATSDLITSHEIQALGGNIGGTIIDNNIQFSLTPAVHSSEIGSPTGFVIAIDGVTIYHAGDTSLFSDMTLIPELFGALDLALVPIGGFFTMDESAAAKAVKLLRPKKVVPIHYNTFDAIKADTNQFKKLAEDFSTVTILDPGQSIEL